MSIGILGKKLGMSQFFDEQGRAVPVTLIEAGPCRITQLKSSDTDGYAAVQIGFGDTREKLINKPAKGHLNKTGETLLRHLRDLVILASPPRELPSREQTHRPSAAANARPCTPRIQPTGR